MAKKFYLSVKESGEGQPWLLVEPTEDIGLEGNQNIIMDLPKGTSIEVANEIMGIIENRIEKFRISRF